MTSLAGRVAVVTGAARGLGREHALFFAGEGACVVVNDSEAAIDGSAGDPGRAEEVAAEIRAAGGQAVANTDDVADWAGGRRLIDTAVSTFGDLHVLVNNAGILRDRYLVNMTDQEWDDVVRVHLKGHFVPTRWAASYWRERSKAGHAVAAAVVNTTSTSGLIGNPGQANYGAAKAGIAAFTAVAAQELGRYGVRCNAVAPMARTRLTTSVPGMSDLVEPPSDAGQFDRWHPANASPLVAYLATEGCPITGRVFFVHGGRVQALEPWEFGDSIEQGGRWTVEELAAQMPRLCPELPG